MGQSNSRKQAKNLKTVGMFRDNQQEMIPVTTDRINALREYASKVYAYYCYQQTGCGLFTATLDVLIFSENNLIDKVNILFDENKIKESICNFINTEILNIGENETDALSATSQNYEGFMEKLIHANETDFNVFHENFQNKLNLTKNMRFS